jgi:hypothetical protein
MNRCENNDSPGRGGGRRPALAAACTAPPDAGIPAANGSASPGPGAATADAVAYARTRRGQATVLPTRS